MLTRNQEEYSRHYSKLRGVDFSNDHSQIDPSRLAYSVNMYKDYKSGQGEALETIAGYRRRADFSYFPKIDNYKEDKSLSIIDEQEIYGIYHIDNTDKVLVHCGNKLWLWDSYPLMVNIAQEKQVTAKEKNNLLYLTIDFPCEAVISVKTLKEEDITDSIEFDKENNRIIGNAIKATELYLIKYYGSVISVDDNPLFSGMNTHKSKFFEFNNKTYIIDGLNYLVYDGKTVSRVSDNAYIPTTYIGITVSEEVVSKSVEYEQRNIMTPLFNNAFIADGLATKYKLYENELEDIVSVKVYDVELEKEDYSIDLTEGSVTFLVAPEKPEDKGFPAGYSGVVITASKNVKFTSINNKNVSVFDAIGEQSKTVVNAVDMINKCSLCATFDGRIFLTGNKDFHNLIFYCSRNNTGYTDPSYWGILNYVQDGVGTAPITGIMPVSDTLMVLKSDTKQDGTVYFHTGTNTDVDIQPRVYPYVQGVSGIGCLGACCNFLDDPVFISRLGVKGISQLKIASERTNEHRSKLIDTKLCNLPLNTASLEEWGGYLCILIDGKMFIGDSRQRYTDETGALQYEWYYIEDIGIWKNQYKEYVYSSQLSEDLQDLTLTHNGEDFRLEIAKEVLIGYENINLCGTTVNMPDKDGTASKEVFTQIVNYEIGGANYDFLIHYTIHNILDEQGNVVDKHAYLCETKDNCIGGCFKKANILSTISDNLFFGTINGIICSFNFDKRNDDGEIPTQYYSFDGRTINCGCATLMDNCGVPHLAKTTIKRSLVIKTKSFQNSAAKIKVRTNKKTYEQIGRINNSLFSFDDMDFSDFTFTTMEQSIYALKEKEKQWVEKQYYIYSDEYLKPFSLYSISYRYRIAGRVK